MSDYSSLRRRVTDGELLVTKYKLSYMINKSWSYNILYLIKMYCSVTLIPGEIWTYIHLLQIGNRGQTRN